jgi:hypothetical protein
MQLRNGRPALMSVVLTLSLAACSNISGLQQ